MEAEDIIQLPTSCGSESGSDRDEAYKSSHELDQTEVDGDVSNGENLGQSMDDAEIEEGQLILETNDTGDVVGDSSHSHARFDFIRSAGAEIQEYVTLHAENGCVNDSEAEEGQVIPTTDTGESAVASLSMLHEHIDFTDTVTETKGKYIDMASENGCVTEHETSNSYPRTDGGSTSGVKRMRTTFDEQQPSVQVKYYGLSRESKRKLEELLREWSEWHARNCSLVQDQNIVSECGEEIYFPALDIGTNKNSAVSFWVENGIRKPQNKDFNPMEDDSVPLYDRGFSLGLISADGSSNMEGGLELLDAPRCFNCGSYSHSLKECPKPRDNVAVNKSRKQLKSRRNQTAGLRNLARYYQDSPGGKYEGLNPGVLDFETKRLLGLGESDPPPWLNRMREIGYPPGYLEPEDENLPSGITIYADEEIKEDKEEGEILEAEVVEPPKKMSVKFPGVNAPIPENADEGLWAARPSTSDRHRNIDGGRSNHPSESNSRGRYREHSNRDFKDDDLHGSERASRYSPRYNYRDFNSSSHSLRENAPRPRSPSRGRSIVDGGRNDPLDSEDSLAYSLYSSFSYSSGTGRRFSEHSNGLDFGRSDRPEYSSSSRDRDERHRHRSGR